MRIHRKRSFTIFTSGAWEMQFDNGFRAQLFPNGDDTMRVIIYRPDGEIYIEEAKTCPDMMVDIIYQASMNKS